MNCVVVGYGYAGKYFHCYLIQHKSNALRLYGVVARKVEMREQIVKELGADIKTFDCLEAALEDKAVNVVILASSNITHAPLAILALRAKRHVVVDKPMALSVNDALEMAKVASENNVLLTAFQIKRWDGDFVTVQQLIQEKKIWTQSPMDRSILAQIRHPFQQTMEIRLYHQWWGSFLGFWQSHGRPTPRNHLSPPCHQYLLHYLLQQPHHPYHRHPRHARHQILKPSHSSRKHREHVLPRQVPLVDLRGYRNLREGGRGIPARGGDDCWGCGSVWG